MLTHDVFALISIPEMFYTGLVIISIESNLLYNLLISSDEEKYSDYFQEF